MSSRLESKTTLSGQKIEELRSHLENMMWWADRWKNNEVMDKENYTADKENALRVLHGK